MSSTYSNLKIELMTTGGNTTTWGDITNTNLGTAIEEAIVGSDNVTFASADVTLTLTNTNTTQTARNLRLRCTGTTGGATRNLVVPSIEKPYIIQNDCADSVQVKTAAGTGITVPAGKTMWVYSDGTNVVDVVTRLSSLTLNTALAVADGGTGATTAPAARTALGATTVGDAVFTATNAAAARTAIGGAASGANTDITALSYTGGLVVGSPTGGAQGAGTINATGLFVNGVSVSSGGSVTSINISGSTTGLTFSGGPITTSGTFTLGGTLAVANGGTGTSNVVAARAVLGVPDYNGSYATGTWSIDISGTAAASQSVHTTNYHIVESGGYLYIKYGTTNICRIDSSGNAVFKGNVTGYGSI